MSSPPREPSRLEAPAMLSCGLAFDEPITSFATPRRLTVVATGLPLQQADRVIE